MKFPNTYNVKKIIQSWKTENKIEKGDLVEGNLIHTPCLVIAVGPYEEVEKYDKSGAMQESIDEGFDTKRTKCVAIKNPKMHPTVSPYAVYPADEVWVVQKRKK